MRASLKNFLTYTIAVAFLAGCSKGGTLDDESRGKADGPAIHVQIQPGGSMCAVRGAKMKCDGVAHHLRDVLKVQSNEYIAVEVDTSQQPIPFDSMTAVIKSLNQRGFTLVIGSVPLPGSGA